MQGPTSLALAFPQDVTDITAAIKSARFIFYLPWRNIRIEENMRNASVMNRCTPTEALGPLSLQSMVLVC